MGAYATSNVPGLLLEPQENPFLGLAASAPEADGPLSGASGDVGVVAAFEERPLAAAHGGRAGPALRCQDLCFPWRAHL